MLGASVGSEASVEEAVVDLFKERLPGGGGGGKGAGGGVGVGFPGGIESEQVP